MPLNLHIITHYLCIGVSGANWLKKDLHKVPFPCYIITVARIPVDQDG